MSDTFLERLTESEYRTASTYFYSTLQPQYNFDWEWDSLEGGGTTRSPKFLAQQIDEMSDLLEDMTPVMAAAQQVAVGNVQERFSTKTTPAGSQWQEWAESYRDRAEGRNIDMLRRDDTLYQAATDESAYPITDSELFIDTTGFPDYWAIQNYGGVAGRGSKIPARTYLGLTAAGAASIVRVFNMWAADAANLPDNRFSFKRQFLVTKTGTIMQRGTKGRIARRFTG